MSNKEKVLKIFDDAGFQAYIVGGTVRDMIMQRPSHDVDITTNATPEQIIEVAEYNNIMWIPTGIGFGTISLVFDDKEEIQVTTFRTDKTIGRHPDVEWTSNLNEDLARRDFKINAMALDKNGHIFDPFNGINDIENKLINTVGDPFDRFNEDKLRTLRAIRFATVLNFKIDDRTWLAIKDTNISEISKERINIEFTKIMMNSNRVNGFKLLDESGLLKQIIPELEAMKGLRAGAIERHPEKDTFIHTIAALSQLDKNESLEVILAVMLHDIGKPPTWNEFNFHGHDKVGAELSETILKRLKFPSYIIEKVKWLVLNHMKIHLFNEMREAKKIRFINHEWFEDLVIVLRADIMVKEDKGILNDIQKFKSAQFHKPAPKIKLINGHDILNAGIKPGPKIAEIMTEIEDLILEGKITNRDQALKHIKIYEIIDRRKNVMMMLS